jgi:hypothetical protein
LDSKCKQKLEINKKFVQSLNVGSPLAIERGSREEGEKKEEKSGYIQPRSSIALTTLLMPTI